MQRTQSQRTEQESKSKTPVKRRLRRSQPPFARFRPFPVRVMLPLAVGCRLLKEKRRIVAPLGQDLGPDLFLVMFYGGGKFWFTAAGADGQLLISSQRRLFGGVLGVFVFCLRRQFQDTVLYVCLSPAPAYELLKVECARLDGERQLPQSTRSQSFEWSEYVIQPATQWDWAARHHPHLPTQCASLQ